MHAASAQLVFAAEDWTKTWGELEYQTFMKQKILNKKQDLEVLVEWRYNMSHKCFYKLS